MAKTYPQENTRKWGVSMTIAAIVLGLYLLSLLYNSTVNQSPSLDQPLEQSQTVR